jgi:superfamily II DNA/RNA helicase
MHRAARAGRFGNKGIAISFIRSIKRELHKDTEDEIVLAAIKKQYEVNMEELPKVIDTTQYF